MGVSQERTNSEKGILSWMSLRFSRARKGSQEPSRSSPPPVSKLCHVPAGALEECGKGKCSGPVINQM